MVFTAALLSTKPFSAKAQFEREEEPKPKFSLKDRIFVGGGVTLSFGTVTALGASPIVGFRITDKLSAGVGFDYVYLKDKRFSPAYETSIYGGNVFGRYTIWRTLFTQAEYGFTSWEAFIYDASINTYVVRRINVPSLLLGGGLAQPIGRNSAFVIMALYDVLHNPPYSYNPSPLTFKAGVNIGF